MTTNKITVDFSEIPDQIAVAEGKHLIEVASVSLKPSASGPFPYLNWELDVISGEDSGRKLFMITSLSPKALFRLKGVLTALDMGDEKFEIEVDPDTQLVISPEFVGKQAVVVVGHEQYQGQTQARVKDVLSADEFDTEAAGLQLR